MYKRQDYDRIRSKLGDASRELEALRSGESYDPDPAERRRREEAEKESELEKLRSELDLSLIHI